MYSKFIVFFTRDYRGPLDEQLHYAKVLLQLDPSEAIIREVILFLRSLPIAQLPKDVLSWFATLTIPCDVAPVFPFARGPLN